MVSVTVAGGGGVVVGQRWGWGGRIVTIPDGDGRSLLSSVATSMTLGMGVVMLSPSSWSVLVTTSTTLMVGLLLLLSVAMSTTLVVVVNVVVLVVARCGGGGCHRRQCWWW